MNKPISMIINETKTNLLQICNQSSLHPSILELIIKDLYNEISLVSGQVLNKEKNEYETKEKDTAK